jgi:V/A-type H+-transporting ATPase subunit C
MTGFEYGNARLRAMKSRLLSYSELESLAESNTVQGLIARLSETAYRKPLEVALARTNGMDCIAMALHNDLVYTLSNTRSYYGDQAGRLVAIVFRRYDIHNFKTILRGLTTHASPDEIMVSMLPVGELTPGMLSELARVQGPRAAIDLLASMGVPLARPLMRLRADKPGSEIPGMEIAMDRWYYEEAISSLQGARPGEDILRSALLLDLDLINLQIVVRFVDAPDNGDYLKQWLGSEDIDQLLLGPGRVSLDLLSQARMQTTLEAAIDTLAVTPFAGALKAGLDAYRQSLLLSEFERHLGRYRLHWLAGLISKDPLGIGLLLGYHALKVNEIRNLRWIAQGINLGWTPAHIKKELEVPI